tara:strand:- start:501 stop:1517 length:1017 start_codon:yes stop_codon:yes gene_type:complete
VEVFSNWCLRQKQYRRAVFFLKITFTASLLSLASCSQLPSLSSPSDWIKTSQLMVKGAVSSFIGTRDTGKSSQYPMLSSFPSRPTLLSTSEDRKKIRNELVSDKKNANYVGVKSKLWPNSMPFKTKPVAPIKTDDNSSQPKVSGKTSLVQTPTNATKNAEKTTQSKAVVAKASTNSDQQQTSSQSSEVKTKEFKFNIPIKVDADRNKKNPLKFQIVDPVSTVNKGVINFEHGSYQLSAADRSFLSKIASEVKETGASVRVVGHASMRTRNMDELKHTLANFNISVKRAEAVASFLIASGVKAEKLIVDAVGDSQPLNYESMPSEERANRRAEIFILKS